MAAIDPHPRRPFDMSEPFNRAETLTPDDANELTIVTRSIMVNVGGDVVVIFNDDTTSVTLTLQAGVVYPFRVKQILATGTTATGIIGLY